jgi:NAD+ kinase
MRWRLTHTVLQSSAMPLQLASCAIEGHFAEPRVLESALLLIAELRRHGIAVLVANDTTAALGQDVVFVPRDELPLRAQLIISIGGDGTLLQAARLAAAHDVPLLGINRGRLGFLTDVLPQEVAASVDALIEGRCSTDRRPLLEARLRRADGTTVSEMALNDVVLLRRETGRMLDFETRVNDRYVNSHSGDGFVVATATGSTAYALSCGGPIIDPQLDVVVLVPICPHTLSDRPVVIASSSTVEINLIEHGEGRADVTCDATHLGDMAPGDQLLIRASGRAVTLLHPPGYDYFRLLRSKLRWGRGAEQHER